MKKLLILIMYNLFIFPMFAISNIILYNWDVDVGNKIIGKIENDYIYEYDTEKKTFKQNPSVKIKNNNLYEFEDGIYSGSILETSSDITISIINENNIQIMKFNKLNGYCIEITNKIEKEIQSVELYDFKSGVRICTKHYRKGIVSFEYYYDLISQVLIKYVYYDDYGRLEGSFLYDDSVENKSVTRVLNNKNELIKTVVIEYSEEGYPIKETITNNKDVITSIKLYNGKSYIFYYQVTYYDDGKLKNELIGDKETNTYTNMVTYSEDMEKTEYTFIQFDEKSNYKLDSNIMLNKSICDYYFMKDYSDESKHDYIDWNENYYALVSKYDFNIRNKEFKYLRYLKDQNYLIQSSTAIVYNTYNSYFYCFSVDDFQIDIDSCYKVELIEKPSF